MEIWAGLVFILILATIGALMDLGDKNDKNSIYDRNNSNDDFWKYW